MYICSIINRTTYLIQIANKMPTRKLNNKIQLHNILLHILLSGYRRCFLFWLIISIVYVIMLKSKHNFVCGCVCVTYEIINAYKQDQVHTHTIEIAYTDRKYLKFNDIEKQSIKYFFVGITENNINTHTHK